MASQLHSMDMDPTKPDTSAPDPDHNVSLSTSISTPSMANVSSSKQSEDFVAPGPSNVTLNTSLDNMDTSGTTPNENQEYMGSNEDALLRLLFLNQNTGEYVRPLSNLFVWSLFFMDFRYELFRVRAERGFCFVGASEDSSCCPIDILRWRLGP